MTEIYQTTNLDNWVAEHLFGWKWIAYRGIPVRGTPGYPADTMVRQFLTPESMQGDRWRAFLAERHGREATGDEPLAYCYCSSSGPAPVPHFSGHEDAAKSMERRVRELGHWDAYKAELANLVGENDADALHFANCEARCRAALTVVVGEPPPEDC